MREEQEVCTHYTIWNYLLYDAQLMVATMYNTSSMKHNTKQQFKAAQKLE